MAGQRRESSSDIYSSQLSVLDSLSIVSTIEVPSTAAPRDGPAINKPHSRFYIPDGFVILKVETTLFRVPKFILEKHSAKCRELLDVGSSTSEATIELPGLLAVDLERFLLVLLPTEIGQHDISTVDEWASVLKVAHLWESRSIRKLAIDQISPLASAVDKVVFGHEYDVPEWVTDGYIELCQRRETLSTEEGRRLGVDDVVHISNIRFELISAQTGSQIKDDSLLQWYSGRKHDSPGNNRVTDYIGMAKIYSETIRRMCMYTQSDGDFSAWLSKRAEYRHHLPLNFESKAADLDTSATTINPSIPTTPFQITLERDQNTNLRYQSISCMPNYSSYSFEELRVDDYLHDRKVASCPLLPEEAKESTSWPPVRWSLSGFGEPTSAFTSTASLFGDKAVDTSGHQGFGGRRKKRR